jgi:riboflavin synthase
MFTGIIKEIGKIAKIKDKTTDREIKVRCSSILKDLKTSDSISVNGVCLTVTETDRDGFYCDVSFNTLNNTSLKYLKAGDAVNLEDSLSASDKLGGHFVNGHVDCISKIIDISKTGDSYTARLGLPPDIRDFIALKGAVAIDGISLTVSGVDDNSFSVVIIPYTFKNTNFNCKNPGDMVNIEVDMLARYLVNFLKYGVSDNINSNKIKDEILRRKLKEYGFTE